MAQNNGKIIGGPHEGNRWPGGGESDEALAARAAVSLPSAAPVSAADARIWSSTTSNSSLSNASAGTSKQGHSFHPPWSWAQSHSTRRLREQLERLLLASRAKSAVDHSGRVVLTQVRRFQISRTVRDATPKRSASLDATWLRLPGRSMRAWKMVMTSRSVSIFEDVIFHPPEELLCGGDADSGPAHTNDRAGAPGTPHRVVTSSASARLNPAISPKSCRG